jgi:pilus assembly protein Flp/PilA
MIQLAKLLFFTRNLLLDRLSRYKRVTPNQFITLWKGPPMLLAPREMGQGLIEYAIILSLVALVVIAVMWLLGPKIGNSYSNISSSIP